MCKGFRDLGFRRILRFGADGFVEGSRPGESPLGSGFSFDPPVDTCRLADGLVYICLKNPKPCFLVGFWYITLMEFSGKLQKLGFGFLRSGSEDGLEKRAAEPAREWLRAPPV